MPARVSIELSDEIFQRVITELEIEDPPSLTLNHSGGFPKTSLPTKGLVRGTYHHGSNHITITTQGESYEREGLYVLTKHLRFSLLHELRHAWQHRNWTEDEIRRAFSGPYALQRGEIDANLWAEYASPKFTGLITVKRQMIGKPKRLPG